MAAATILYIGDDTCRRIPIFKRAGLSVVHAEWTLPSIREALRESTPFDAATFHIDARPIEPLVLPAVRETVHGPLILFDNPSIPYDEDAFDLVIPPLTAPDIWIKRLHVAIEVSRNLRAASLRLREDVENVHRTYVTLRESIAKSLTKIDPDAPWHDAGREQDEKS